MHAGELVVAGDAERASSESHDAFLATRTFGSLDGLRAISIVAVLWHHTQDGFPGWLLASRGFLGVDLFFVISGFLIVTLLLRERRRTGAISLRRFYVRRVLRIFPPYYAMLLFVAAVAYLKPGGTSHLVKGDLPFALLYVANLVEMQSLLGITWSLAVEEQFYLVVPAVERFVRRGLVPLLLVGAYVLAVLPPFGLFPEVNLPAFFRETTFGPILLGVMLAHFLDDPRGYRLASRVLGHPASPLVAGALVLAACCHPAQDISGLPRMTIHAALLALVASCVVRERHALSAALELWPMRRIGAVSYGIYLFHLLVMHAVNAGMSAGGVASPGLRFVATLLGTWAVAELSFRLFESRFIALKERWA
jgi:peptidoglycan/LPS O-acetylase OafA/YrhL